MKQLRKITALIICFSLVMVLAACSGNSPSDGASEDSSQPESTMLRIAVFPEGNVFNAVAAAQGYYTDEGITVEAVQITTDEEAFNGITEGTIDIVSNSGTNLPLQKISEGMDLTIFGGYQLTGSMPVFTRADTEWNSIEDLIGKTMACEPNMFAITGPLLDKGYDPVKDIKWLPCETQADRIKAVKEGKADFGLVGTMYNYAVNSDHDLKVCTYASDVLPDYSCCRIEASTEWVNSHPNSVKALLRAWIRAMAYYESHHDETVALVAETAGLEEVYVRAYMDNPHLDLNIDPMKSSVLRAWDYMDRLGLLGSSPDTIGIEDHINVELYKEALDECQARYGDQNPKFYEKMQGQYAKNNL